MTLHPAKGCTKRQIEAFEAIAVNQNPGATFKTLGALEKKGLIERIADKVVGQDRFGIIAIPQYEVPLPVHYQWCQWCSENVEEE